MPWRVSQRDGKFCVVKISSGEVVACHATREKANAQREALYANTDYGLQLAIQDFNLEFDKESDVNRPGGSHNLKNYWVRGPGAAKIRWGTDGSFDRCVRQVGKYVRDPKGLCAEYHHAATGEWPRGGTVPSAGDMEEFHGNHNQQDHDPHKGFHVPDADVAKLNSLKGMKPGDVKVSKSRKDLTRSRILGTRAAEPEDVDRRRDEDDEVDLRGLIGGDLEDMDADDIEDALSEIEDRIIILRAKKVKGTISDSESRELERLRQAYRLPKNQFAAAMTTKVTKRPKKKDDDDDTQTYATGETDEPWAGVLSVEGIESGDGRLFGLGSLDWERPPQPLMYQPANVGGHSGSIMVGNIQKITRHGSRIRGEGVVFGSALAGPHGQDIRHMMENGGVSVDVDSVKDADVEQVFADGQDGGDMFAKPETTIFHRGRIRGATLVAYPAFVEAKLSFTGETLTASVDAEDCGCDLDTDPLIASTHTITIPNLPKAEWFNEPTDVKLSGALTITDEGRVFGLVAPSDTTHRSVKTYVPRSVDFSRFHKAETIVEGGGRVVTGVITANCGHAPTENYGTLANRIEHYDNSCSVLANVRVGYARNGSIWVAGALNPGADPRQVAQALGCTLSLDVQPHPDRPGVREFIAAHLVPVPGFPMARTQASVTYQDGLITASAVPVTHVSQPTYVDRAPETALTFAKRVLAESLELDPKSRKMNLMRELELI